MKLNEFINKVLFYVSVPKCVSCKTCLEINEKAFCDTCLSKYTELKNRNCSVCNKTLSFCTCTIDYLGKHYVKELIKVYRYFPGDELPTNSIIYSLKRDDRKDVVEFLSDELKCAISHNIDDPSNYIFTNVPRRRKSVSKYGVDHAEMLAKELAKIYGAEYYQPLVSKTTLDQKKMQGRERISNAQYAYKRNLGDLSGKSIILVDDIVTTGASMGAVAMLLRGLGAKRIIGATISIAYKDPYVKLNKNDRFKIQK